MGHIWDIYGTSSCLHTGYLLFAAGLPGWEHGYPLLSIGPGNLGSSETPGMYKVIVEAMM
jgi:hypothetical protein